MRGDSLQRPRVVNQRYSDYTVYIGRSGKGASSIWGNPIRKGDVCFVCGLTHETGGSTLPCFESWARARITSDPVFRAAFADLTGQVLGCFCKPQPCHGDILVRLWEEIMAPSVQTHPLFTPQEAGDPGVATALEQYELAMTAAPPWLGDFSLKAWSLVEAPAPLAGLAARMVEAARGLAWVLPQPAQTHGGYNTLYLQRYFAGQYVSPHQDPKNNRHSVLLLSLGAHTPAAHTIDGKVFTFAPGTLVYFHAWLEGMSERRVSPLHSMSPLPTGERWALILTHNDQK